ncbi:MAG: cytochrome-c peroxidase, partial [Bacteroidota bacterium]|nr:cytochrome-c peroxidase [Bacteroidota bacterium]
PWERTTRLLLQNSQIIFHKLLPSDTCMKKTAFFILLFISAMLILVDCKHDPKIVPLVAHGDDSLYHGVPYKIPEYFIFNFPTLINPYKDSLTWEGIQLGRRLFYDKHLSVDGQKSCGSCHRAAEALSDSGFALSTNEFGLTKRNAPALQNLAWSNSFFWDGRQPTAAAQAQDAYQHELGLVVNNAVTYLQADSVYARLFRKAFGRPGTISADKIYLAVQEFMMYAVSSNSKFDRVMRGDPGWAFTPSEDSGFTAVFNTERGDCFHCHTQGGIHLLMTDMKFHNNGLDPANSITDFVDAGRGGITGVAGDYGTFKSPTLRNIAVTGPYMHDGRFKTLSQVIDFYSDSLNLSINDDLFILRHLDTTNTGQVLPRGGMHLTATEKQELLDFLNTLTDTTFLNDPNLRNPF